MLTRTWGNQNTHRVLVEMISVVVIFFLSLFFLPSTFFDILSSFFLSWKLCSLSFDFHHLWWEVKHHCYYCFLEGDVSFSFWLFVTVSYYLWFLGVWWWFTFVVSFVCLFYLGFTYLLGYWIDVFKFCRFLTSIFSNIPSALFFLSSPGKTPVTCMWALSHGSLMICSIFLTLCFSLGFFYYCLVFIHSSHFLLCPVSLSLINSTW